MVLRGNRISTLNACCTPPDAALPGQLSMWRRRYYKVAWAVIRLLGKRGDSVVTNGNHSLVHRNFSGGTAKHLNWGSWLSFTSWLLLDQLGGNYLVFLYLICSTKIVCEDREEVLGKNSKDIVLKLKYSFLSFVLRFLCQHIFSNRIHIMTYLDEFNFWNKMYLFYC